MIRHAMDVVKTAVNKMNPGQVSVVTFDQLLYAIAKQVQWNWPNTHGENLFVVMLQVVSIRRWPLSKQQETGCKAVAGQGLWCKLNGP